MIKPDGCEYGIYFDKLHIITVNFEREEARLFENGGSGNGKVLFKKDKSAAKVSATDPFQLMNLAFHFVISYELLSQVADEAAQKFFEQVGAKEFLERLVAATSEEERRNRVNGIGPKFNGFDKVTKPPERRGKSAKEAATPSPKATSASG